MNDRGTTFERKRLLGVLAVLTFGLTALTAVLGLVGLTPVIFVFGFFIVVPLVAILGDSLPFVASAGEAGDRAPDADAVDPVERLRDRYARGDISDEEFERRLERLIETEGVEAGETRERVFERE
ncbi:SHOCT domain-containing protein [Halorussus marinus]|uniref:SHOCT domain-containing protein n=1 Tax=Halorussus marinus TaxID=2505976 RepID=UPI00106EC931|nr:SHOCT domain-containing protein [Halorussus marinus]